MEDKQRLRVLPAINEIKNYLEGINSRITEAEEWISDMEDKIVEITTDRKSVV